MPPRRHELCISNIRKLGTAHVSKFNSDKLFLETMLAAKQQTWRLRNRKHEGRPWLRNVCRDIQFIFYDFRDIIQGTDKSKDAYSVDGERNLKAIFQQIRDQRTQNGDTSYNDSTDTMDGLGQVSSDWWGKNKNKIWEAFHCGTRDKPT